jgi:hypothetical protein
MIVSAISLSSRGPFVSVPLKKRYATSLFTRYLMYCTLLSKFFIFVLLKNSTMFVINILYTTALIFSTESPHPEIHNIQHFNHYSKTSPSFLMGMKIFILLHPELPFLLPVYGHGHWNSLLCQYALGR